MSVELFCGVYLEVSTDVLKMVFKHNFSKKNKSSMTFLFACLLAFYFSLSSLRSFYTHSVAKSAVLWTSVQSIYKTERMVNSQM